MNDELEKLKGDKKLPAGVILKRTLAYVKPEIKQFILAIFLVGLNVLIDVLSPLFTSTITDELLQVNINIRLIIILSVSMFVVGMVNQLFFYIESIILQKCGQRIIYRLRMEVFEHIERMSLNQFNEMPVGSLVTRVSSYTASMSDLFTSVLVRVLKNLTTIFGVYAVMIVISPSLSFILSGVCVLVFVISFYFSKVIRQVFTEERRLIIV